MLEDLIEGSGRTVTLESRDHNVTLEYSYR